MLTKKNLILKYALISSPLLALFGICPFFIFDILDVKHSVFLLFGVFLSVLFYWVTNYLIIYKYNLRNKLVVVLLSFFLAFLSKVIFLFIGAPLLAFKATIAPFMIYPAVVTVALNSFVLFIVYYLKRENEISKADKLIANLNLENITAQKQTLIRQLQPHFLFNSLSVLKSLIHENSEKAENYTLRLSNFLRYSVDSTQKDTVTIKEELAFASNFIALQKLRFEEAFSVEINIPENILDAKIPTFSIQTGIENALKHNRFTQHEPLNITINYEKQCLIISNSVQLLESTHKNGIGLFNLKKRYELMGVSGFRIIQTEGLFCLYLPIIES